MTLTRLQLRLLWVGIGLIVLMCLIPPWEHYHDSWIDPAGQSIVVPASKWHHLSYRPLFFQRSSARIEYLRLAFQCFLVAFLTATGIFAIQQRDKRRESGS